MDDIASNEQPVGKSWFVPRPTPHLMILPNETRWEVTRRHPYYLRFWKLTQQLFRQPSQDLEERNLQESAKLILLAIGVSGEPPDPSVAFQEIGSEMLGRIWGDGAIAPVTYRGLAQILLGALPPEAARDVAALFICAGSEEDDRTDRLYWLLNRLQQFRHEILDRVPPRPIVGVNIHAPQNRIISALTAWVQQLKQQEEIGETRRRDDKHEDYLAVWDAREGWTGGAGYDILHEQTLREIATEHSKSISTIANQYKSAFHLIAGHDYSPELWARMLGFLKILSCIDIDEMPSRYRQGIFRNKNRGSEPVQIPETQLMSAHSPDSPANFLDIAGIAPDEIGSVDLTLDMQTLIAKGKTNAEIVKELELPSDGEGAVQYIRERSDDKL